MLLSLQEFVTIEVVYAQPQRATVKDFRIAAPATVADALAAAAADRDFAEWDIAQSAVGVFGRRVHLHQSLSNGDRVEIYRPLLSDPKSARRARAKKERCG